MRYALAVLMLLLIATAAWAQCDPANMSPNTWCEETMVNTAYDVRPCPTGSCGYNGVEGANGVIDDWNSAAVCTRCGTKGTYLLWGGGHKGYCGNEIYSYDVATRTWSLVMPPGADGVVSDCETEAGDGTDNFCSTLSNGTPAVPHTWDSVHYHPKTNQWINLVATACAATGFGDNARATLDAWDFDIDTSSNAQAGWVLGQTTNQNTGNNSSHVTFDVEHDRMYEVTVSHSPTILHEYNVTSPAVASASNFPTMEWDSGNFAWIPQKDMAVFFEGEAGGGTGHQPWGVDLHACMSDGDCTGDVVLLTTSGCTAAFSEMVQTQWWLDPGSGDLYAWPENGGRNVWKLSVPAGDWTTGTWTCTEVTDATGDVPTNASPANGVYKRWNYVPAVNAYILLNGISQNVFWYKASAGTAAPACWDGLDNDGDGLYDLADPDCTSYSDTNEASAGECNDGVDNDMDGKTDYAEGDEDCYSATDPTEDPCSDGSAFCEVQCSLDGVVRCYGFEDMDDITTGNPRNTTPTTEDASRVLEVGSPCTLQGQTGLMFPTNADVDDNKASSPAFEWQDPEENGLPIYGAQTTGSATTGVTYIWQYYPIQQTGYYTSFFWGNRCTGDPGCTVADVFQWDGGPSGNAQSYYGAHPYPPGGTFGTTHNWEISVFANDYTGATVTKGQWYYQALRVWSDASGNKHHVFYYDITPGSSLGTSIDQTIDGAFSWGDCLTGAEADCPPNAALTWGDAPWKPGAEVGSGIFRGIQIYNVDLGTSDLLTEVSTPLGTTAGANNIWYMNTNPTPDDISDKSGAGHNPTWLSTARPTLWTSSTKCWDLDTDTKYSDDSSLRIQLIPGAVGDDQFRLNFNDDYSKRFGLGESFEVKYRYRVKSGWVGTGLNWKVSLIGVGDYIGGAPQTSCSDLEVVVNNYNYGGLQPQAYHSCAQVGAGCPDEPCYPAFAGLTYYDNVYCNQVRLQDTDSPYCCYDDYSGCWYWTGDTWYQVRVRVDVGSAWNTPDANNRIRFWITPEGGSEILIQDSDNSGQDSNFEQVFHNTDSTNYKWGKVWLGPYQPDQTTAQSVWYDDLVITEIASVSVCGDGTIDVDEQCDDGASNGTISSCCSAICTYNAPSTACSDDGQFCTTDLCNSTGTCVHAANTGADCESVDNTYCNGASTCGSDGLCSVHAGDPCAANVGDADADCSESCDETSETCTANDPDGSACDDGLFCYDSILRDGTDQCSSGACTGGTSGATCDDSNLCTDDSCDDVANACVNTTDPTNDPSCLQGSQCSGTFSIGPGS